MGLGGSSNKSSNEFPILDDEKNLELLKREISLYYQNRMTNLGKINLIICGRSGVGKTTFLKKYFKNCNAETGVGRPIRTEIEQITDDDNPLSIYDTPGIELNHDRQEQLIKDISSIIKNKKKTRDIKQQIHCMLYCVNVENKRIESYEVEFIQKFSLPVIIILTQSYDSIVTKMLQDNIIKMNIKNVTNIVPIVAETRIMGNGVTFEASGENEFINAIDAILPEKLKDTLQNYQTASILHKRRRSIYYISKAALSAIQNFGNINYEENWNSLISIENMMLVNITIIYGFGNDYNFQTRILCNSIGWGTYDFFGDLAKSEIKRTVLESRELNDIISPELACIITKALGMTYISIVENINNFDLSLADNFNENVKSIFIDYLQKVDCEKYIYEPTGNLVSIETI